MKQKVIIITTYFPPIQSIACNRMVSFAKYLNPSIFDITVVTLDDNSKEIFELPNVEIIRIKNSPFFKLSYHTKRRPFLIKKTKSLYNRILLHFTKYTFGDWKTKATRVTEQILQKEKNAIVISSYAPTEAHLVPLELKKKGYDFKWIADFRDEMSLNPYNPPRWKEQIQKDEKLILAKIDGLITISEIFVERFKKLTNRDSIEYQEIRNGYDFDISNLKHDFSHPTFNINCFGNIYTSIDLKDFFAVVSEIHSEKSIPNFQINLIGVGENYPVPAKLKEIIHISGKIPHLEAIKQMKESDSLLFILPNIGWTGVYSGKLFEYLGAKRPIIALTDPDDVAAKRPIIALTDPDDVAAKLIQQCNAGFVADFNRVDKIKKAILDAYELWKKREDLNYNEELIVQLHRKNQIKKLSQMMVKMSENHKETSTQRPTQI